MVQCRFLPCLWTLVETEPDNGFCWRRKNDGSFCVSVTDKARATESLSKHFRSAKRRWFGNFKRQMAYFGFKQCGNAWHHSEFQPDDKRRAVRITRKENTFNSLKKRRTSLIRAAQVCGADATGTAGASGATTSTPIAIPNAPDADTADAIDAIDDIMADVISWDDVMQAFKSDHGVVGSFDNVPVVVPPRAAPAGGGGAAGALGTNTSMPIAIPNAPPPAPAGEWIFVGCEKNGLIRPRYPADIGLSIKFARLSALIPPSGLCDADSWQSESESEFETNPATDQGQ